MEEEVFRNKSLMKWQMLFLGTLESDSFRGICLRNGEPELSMWMQSRLILLSFGREDLEKFLCYFQFITGTIDDKDKTVQRLISEGYLYG